MAAGTSPATSPKGRGGRVSSFPVRLPLYRTNGPAGGIGRRSRFRSCRREAWGFESLAGHHRHDQHRTGRFERSGEPRRRRVSCPARRDRTGSAEAEPRTGCGAPARAAREGRPSARPSTDAASAPAGRPAAPPAAPLRAASPGRAQGQARSRRPRVAPAASLPADRRAPPRPARARAGEEAGGGAGGGGAGGSAAGVTEPVVATSTRAAGLASRASASRGAERAPAGAGSAARCPTGGTAARQSRV